MKKLALSLILILGLQLLSSCVTTITQPKGSVLEYDGNYLGARNYLITARVQNIGGDGTFNVYAEISYFAEFPDGAEVSTAIAVKHTEIYLKTGQQETLSFDFQIRDIQLENPVFHTRVYCSNSTLTPTPR